ncbi:signal transduction histidine kinase/ligand-binding sensor domain-containing protein/DNA-binding response OmpR family regulator [Flammeovirga yaeyamensis]|nr:signal transduction histidine kinase/ligand-binding sensor domain-containing protein/DNA-binding response OmpR family regulator [Flammeovirga yaeyamensis]
MKLYFNLVVLTLLSFTSFAQPALNNTLYKSYSMPEGLSHYGVTSVIEDHNGLLWVGTFDGLNTFDGFEFKTFRDENGLNSNRVRSLFQDDEDNIWVGTDHGISLYDYATQKFINLHMNLTPRGVKAGPVVRQFQNYGDKILCTTERSGLLIFDKKTKKLEQTIDLLRNELSYKTIILPDDKLLIASTNAVIVYNLRNQSIEKVNGADKDRYMDIAKYDDRTYIAIGSKGVNVIKKNKNNQYISQAKLLRENKYHYIDIDKDQNIWLAHKEIGLDKYSLKRLLKEKEPLTTLNTYRVNTMFIDEEGNKWVGSLRKGLYQIPFYQNVFEQNRLRIGDGSPKWSNHVLHIQKYDSTNIIINVHFRGIINFNTEKNIIEPLPEQFKYLKGQSNASIYIDREGGQFVKKFSKQGIHYYMPKGGKKWRLIRAEDNQSFANTKIKDLLLDKHGYHWFATSDGLYRLKLSHNGKVLQSEFINELPRLTSKKIDELRYIYEDPKYNFIWIGTKYDGLIRINNQPDKPLAKMKKAQFIHDESNKYSVSSNFVSCIQRLDNGELWIGTEGGGICLVENSQLASTFKRFDISNGLDNNVVKTIQGDKNGKLWITTNKGLNAFDLKSRSFRNFTVNDGVRISPFEPSSVVMDDGKLVFAGGNGLLYFYPEAVVDSVPMPNFMFGDFKVFNQKIAPLDTLDEKVILTKSLDKTKKIELDYDENVFSLELISLHYTKSKGHLIKYRMLPQETEWVTVPSELKFANYNGLPPGDYTFQVAVSNSKKEWSAVREIEIVIHPPIWRTVWAYLLYVVTLIVVVVVIMRFMLRMNNLKHDLELQHIEKERVEELDKTRTRLFMNIAHEFRTPLTLISGPLQILINMFESNNDANKHLTLIERQSKKMFQLVNQVQDFQKAEQSLLKLKMTSFDFTELINEIKKGFDQLAEHTNKKLTVVGEAHQLFTMADRQKLEIVLNNLLNNAFKFTKEGDEITLTYGVKDEKLFFAVSDNGFGISEKDLPHIFERYYQSEDTNTSTVGSGIGLAFSKRIVELHYGEINAESEKNVGTTFNVLLPVEVNLKDTFNENRLQEVLQKETDEEKQRILPKGIELPESLIDESLKELNIYYVEDNRDLREFVSTSLSDYFNITSFEHGKQCMEAVESEWPDLIISDILMPEMNGLELCKMIKTDIRTSHIPVVLLTSRSSVDDQVLGLESGADAYISKPFDMKHLIATTQMLLKNRKQLRERFSIDFPVDVEKKNNNKSDRVFMEKLYGLMEKYLDDEELDINIFIKELHLNRTHFYQKVKSITNHTPYELLKLYRLKKAAEFLVKEKLTVSEVYMRTGFKSRTHFSRMFKEHYGITPGKYGKEAVVEEETV